MKKIILTAAVILTGIGATFAQATATDNATLNVKLHAIQSIEVNPAQKVIDLNYTTKEHYAEGVKAELADHLTVYSTGAFAVKVASDADQITSAGAATRDIESNTLRVKAAMGASKALAGAKVNEVPLSTTATDLITSTVGGVDRNFNITYKGAGANAYVNKYFNDETPTVYSTVVTYTIEAR